MSFGLTANAYKALADAKANDLFTIVSEKKPGADGKEYWTWLSASQAAPGTMPEPTNQPKQATGFPVKNTYETPEERAKRQVLIVRQSSLSSAIELLKTDKKSPTVPEVLQVAKQFEAYVFGNDDPFGLESKEPVNKLPTVEDLEDDIPM